MAIIQSKMPSVMDIVFNSDVSKRNIESWEFTDKQGWNYFIGEWKHEILERALENLIRTNMQDLLLLNCSRRAITDWMRLLFLIPPEYSIRDFIVTLAESSWDHKLLHPK